MSDYGFCHLSVIPLRETPSDKSQMTSQLLFGDVFTILERENNWLKIENAYDSYSAWIDEKQQLQIDASQFDKLKNPKFTNTQTGAMQLNNRFYSILPASSIPSENEFEINNFRFKTAVNLKSFSNKDFDDIPSLALSYLHAPYLWGGKSLFGIDCSGFTQSVYKMAGIQILRDASQQAEQGETLSFLSEAQAGDLIFFDNEEGQIIHVGIYLGKNKLIHASGKVRIDKIDHHGIFNAETKTYTHNLRLIKTHS